MELNRLKGVAMQTHKINLLEKRIVLHLSNGEAVEHALTFETETKYYEWLTVIGLMLKKTKPGFIVMDNPYGFYRLEAIIGIDFLDPPPANKREPLGYLH